MDKLTRRSALAATAALGMAGLAAAADEPTKLPKADDKQKPREMTDQEYAQDRKRVIACGLTEAEADCWEAVGRAAMKFFALPKLHTMDDHEVAHAIHVIQYRLLSRPAYRKYLQVAKGQKKEGK
jgi:hypothetical protein